MILLASEYSMSSPDVEREWRSAQGFGTPVVVWLIANCSLPGDLRPRAIVDLRSDPLDRTSWMEAASTACRPFAPPSPGAVLPPYVDYYAQRMTYGAIGGLLLVAAMMIWILLLSPNAGLFSALQAVLLGFTSGGLCILAFFHARRIRQRRQVWRDGLFYFLVTMALLLLLWPVAEALLLIAARGQETLAVVCAGSILGIGAVLTLLRPTATNRFLFSAFMGSWAIELRAPTHADTLRESAHEVFDPRASGHSAAAELVPSIRLGRSRPTRHQQRLATAPANTTCRERRDRYRLRPRGHQDRGISGAVDVPHADATGPDWRSLEPVWHATGRPLVAHPDRVLRTHAR